MRMYKIQDIMDVLEGGLRCHNKYCGFGVSEDGNLKITLKEHEPNFRDENGCGEAVEELELLHSEGEY